MTSPVHLQYALCPFVQGKDVLYKETPQSSRCRTPPDRAQLASSCGLQILNDPKYKEGAGTENGEFQELVNFKISQHAFIVRRMSVGGKVMLLPSQLPDVAWHHTSWHHMPHVFTVAGSTDYLIELSLDWNSTKIRNMSQYFHQRCGSISCIDCYLCL